MPDYSQGKIYSIRSYLTDDVYYGSTIETLTNRLAGHKRKYKLWLENKVLTNYSSYRIFEKDIDAYIELVELYPCNSKIELHRKEGEIIRANVCVNKLIAGRTREEWKKDNKEQIKQYYQDNKQQIAERNKQYRQDNKEIYNDYYKQYYQDNKEEILEHNKQYRQNNKEQLNIKYTCECGSISIKTHKTRHEKTKKHQAFISQ
jgi:hypothetical protein